MHAVSSSETNTPGSAPQLPQATEEEEEVQYLMVTQHYSPILTSVVI